MHRLIVICSLLATLRCASSPTVSEVAPMVTIAQVSTVAPLRMSVASGLPVEYRIDISNPLDRPLTLTSVEFETVGETGAYALKRVRHAFSRSIAAHSRDSFIVRAWVRTIQESDTGQVNTPVTIRGVAHFDSASGARRTAFSGRVQ